MTFYEVRLRRIWEIPENSRKTAAIFSEWNETRSQRRREFRKENFLSLALSHCYMSVTYREGTDLETQQLDSLWEAIGWKPRGEEKWKEVLSKSGFMFTAWDGNRLVGTGCIVEDGIMCMFYDIGVHPDYQRRGIGAKILQKLIKRVKNKRYASIGLFTWEENPANVPFYEKFGFVKTSGMELTKHMKPE